MATLTDTADFVKRSFGFFVLGTILIFVLVLGLPPFLKSLKTEEKPPPPKPEAAFGKLPRIEFPENKKYPASFVLENIEGRPPEATTSAKVYFVPQKSINLFSRRNAINFAAKLGFASEPRTVSTTLYSFVEPGRELLLDITNFNFTLKTDFLGRSVPKNNVDLEKPEAASIARNYFSATGNFDQTLTRNKAIYIYYDGQNFQEAEKSADANLVRVDFFHEELDGLPILTPESDQSAVYVIFTRTDERKTEIVEASYQNFAPDLNAGSTYPLITSKQAWEDLKNGKGYIVQPLFEGEEAVVRQIYLAYAEIGKHQPYIQPVFVFEGDKGFMGMTPAVDPSLVGS